MQFMQCKCMRLLLSSAWGIFLLDSSLSGPSPVRAENRESYMKFSSACAALVICMSLFTTAWAGDFYTLRSSTPPGQVQGSIVPVASSRLCTFCTQIHDSCIRGCEILNSGQFLAENLSGFRSCNINCLRNERSCKSVNC